MASREQVDHWMSEYETHWRLDWISRCGDREKRTDLGGVWGGFGMLVDKVGVTDERKSSRVIQVVGVGNLVDGGTMNKWRET